MKLIVIDMSIDFCGCNAFVSENLLQRLDINMPILVHGGCGCVAEFMSGQAVRVDA